MVERRNIFSFGPARMASGFQRPFSAFRVEEPEPPTVARTSEPRLSMAERAAEQARRDLAAEKTRKGLDAEGDDDKDEKIARRTREGTLAERARILSILTAPVALRQSRLAKKFALESDVPPRDAIAADGRKDPKARTPRAAPSRWRPRSFSPARCGEAKLRRP